MPGSPIQKVLAWVSPVLDRPEAAVDAVPIRRSARIPLSIPIIISGKDDLGRTFKENTRTVEVSKNGAKILSSHRLAIHADIAVANPVVGRTCLAKVTWRGARRAKGPLELGIELLESFQPERIWGLESPPDDWLRGPSAPTADQRLQYLCARDRTRQADFEAAGAPETPEILPTPVPAPGAPVDASISAGSNGATLAPPTPSAPMREMSEEEVQQQLALVADAVMPLVTPRLEKSLEESTAQMAERLVKDLEAQAESVSRSAEEAVESVRSASTETTAKLETLEAGFVGRAEDYQRKLTETTASGVEELRQNSQSLLEDFRARLQDSLKGLEEDKAKEITDRLERVATDSEAQAGRRLEEHAASMIQKLGAELEASGTQLVSGAREQLSSVTLASLQSVTHEAQAVAEECRQRLIQTFEQNAGEVANRGSAAADTIARAKSETLAEFQSAQREAEAALEGRAAGYEKQLADVATSGAEQLEHKSDALLAGFQGQLQTTLENFQERGTKEVADRLQKIAAELEGRSAEYLEQQTKATVERLSQELTASGQGIAEEARKQARELVAGSLESLGREAETITGRAQEALDAVHQAAGEAVGSLNRETETITGRAHDALDAIGHASTEAVTRLESTEQKVAANFERDAAGYQKQFSELAASSLEGLSQRSNALREELQKQGTQWVQTLEQRSQAFSETAAAAAGSVEAAAQKSLTELEARRQQVERELGNVAQGHEGRLTAMFQSSAEAIQSKAGALLGEFETQHAGLARSFQEQTRVLTSQADASVGSVQLASDQAISKLQTAQQQIASGLEARVEDHRQQLVKLAASGVSGLEQRSSALVQDLQGRFEKTLQHFQDESKEGFAEQLRQMAGELEAHSADRLEQQTRATLARLNEKLAASNAEMVNSARKELASATQMSLESVTWATAKECRSQLDRIFREQNETVSGAANDAVKSIQLAAEQTMARLQTAEQKVEVASEANAKKHQEEFSELATASTAALERASTSLLEGFQGRLKSSVQTLEERSGQELEGMLRKIAAEIREQSSQQLRKHAEETEKKLKEGLTASGVGVVEEARRLAGITHTALETLTQSAAEECRKKIDEFKRTTQNVRSQIAEVAGAQTESAESEIESSVPKRSRRTLFATLGMLVALVAPVLTVVYMSTRPVMRLRTEPPTDFVETNPSWNAKRRSAEAEVARAYWSSALENVQQLYHFGMNLPDEPPASFNVSPDVAMSGVGKADAAAARTRYWQKLRNVWGQPEAWEEAYGWHTDWMTSVSMSLQEAAVKVQWELGNILPSK